MDNNQKYVLNRHKDNIEIIRQGSDLFRTFGASMDRAMMGLKQADIHKPYKMSFGEKIKNFFKGLFRKKGKERYYDDMIKF